MSSKDIVRRVKDCCREVRLGAIPCQVGETLAGWNTITNEYESWLVVSVDKVNQWDSLVKRVFNDVSEHT